MILIVSNLIGDKREDLVPLGEMSLGSKLRVSLLCVKVIFVLREVTNVEV